MILDHFYTIHQMYGPQLFVFQNNLDIHLNFSLFSGVHPQKIFKISPIQSIQSEVRPQLISLTYSCQFKPTYRLVAPLLKSVYHGYRNLFGCTEIVCLWSIKILNNHGRTLFNFGRSCQVSLVLPSLTPALRGEVNSRENVSVRTSLISQFSWLGVNLRHRESSPLERTPQVSMAKQVKRVFAKSNSLGSYQGISE